MGKVEMESEHYFEILEKANKWDEKERFYKPTESGYNVAGFYVICKCSEKVYSDDHIKECYCTHCGQKVDLESECER